jgi:chorismate mutase/prephenate dehydratase
MSEARLPDPSQIDGLRLGVDRIDHEILGLLAARRELAREIAAEKRRTERPLFDDERERKLMTERLAAAERHRLDPGLVSRVWKHILDDSLRVQHQTLHVEWSGRHGVKAAVQGIEGSYSRMAAREFLGGESEEVAFVGCARFEDATAAVVEGRADIAVLPIENTTSGGIAEVYDLLLNCGLSVVGEIKLLVRHCLLGVPGATVSGLRKVYGHPQAVAQCTDFLLGLPDVEVVYFGDTALSGRRISEMGDATVGAIASEEAASIFGLEVLQAGIGNREKNYTRFVVVAREPIAVDLSVPAKTSLVLSVGNEPGALMEVLAEFRDHNIALVKLESRPTADNPWEEMFYLDFDGNVADPGVAEALDGVRKRARFMRVLGTYPSRDLRPRKLSRKQKPRDVGVTATPSISTREVPADHRLAGRAHDMDDSVVEVKGVRIGGEELVTIAGPCAVESWEQVMACAEAVRRAGGSLLRGGCFKPRTSPYSFQGLGYEGLEMLAEAGRAHGLPIITEVPAPEHVERIARYADVLQIGTRNMQNFALLAEVGRTARPVMLKRGMSASIDELLHAAEYILSGGNQQVMLCERGIRTFETSSRNTLDITAVPVLRRRTHLPVIVDPSHAAGSRELVAPLTRAAVAVGAHGIMIEIHPEPEKALSDGPQALRLDEFAELMTSLGHSSQTAS